MNNTHKKILEKYLDINININFLEEKFEYIETLDIFEKYLLIYVIGKYQRTTNLTFLKEKLTLIDFTESLNLEDIEDLYVLGAVYGGLKSINYYLKLESINKKLKEIKRFVFKNFIKKGYLCSNTKKDISTELLLSCSPFGLFEPEDLVLVASVDYLKENNLLLTDDNKKLYYLMYLLDRGYYLEFQEIFTNFNKENNTIYDYIKSQKELKHVENMGEIIHKPFGNDNRYKPQHYERFPKIITENEDVTIWCTCFSNIIEDIKLYYVVDEKKYELTMQKKLDYYEAIIPKNHSNSKIEYWISNKYMTTEKYCYYINKERILDIKGILSEKNVFKFILGSDSFELPLFLYKNQKGILNISNIKKETTDLIEINNETLELLKSKIDYFKVILDENNKIIRYSISYKKQIDEKFYGFGERYNSLAQENNTIDNYVFNQYKGQGLKTYFPIPYFVSNKKYGMFINTNNYSKIDLKSTTVNISLENEDIDLYIWNGDIKTSLEKYYTIVGFPKMIPKWGLGPWMSSNNWDSQKIVLDEFNKTLEEEIPATVLVIEAWSDEATFYRFNDSTFDNETKEYSYPKWGRWEDPKAMVNYLHKNNTKCILWQIPVIKYTDNLLNKDKDDDEVFAINNDYVVKTKNNKPYRIPEDWFINSLVIDFTNKEATNWWFDKRKYLTENIGIDGFKTDGGECIFGRDVRFSNGLNGLDMRNCYPVHYETAYSNFVNNYTEGMVFSRAGYIGSHLAPAHWAGDERSTFAGFKRNLIAGLNAGLSGIVFWGWDLAGFSGEIPSADLYIRSTQMACFCPIMQYHAESKAEFNQDRTPWNIAERTGVNEVVDIYRFFANLRMQLLPYIYNESRKCCELGKPLMRALVYDYFEDENCSNILDEYMFGDSLLIAPIVDENRSSRKLYLPEGEWKGFFNNKLYTGGQIIEYLCENQTDFPVFIKENSIIPLNLDSKVSLGTYMGNNVDEYKNLTFIKTNSISSITFNDNLGNKLIIDKGIVKETTFNKNNKINIINFDELKRSYND